MAAEPAPKTAARPPDVEVLQDTAEHFDELCNQALRRGGEPIIHDGEPVLDPKTGEVLRQPVSTAFLEVVRKRLKDCRISGSNPRSKTKGLGGMVSAMRDRGEIDDGPIKFPSTKTPPPRTPALPPLSGDADAATRGA